MRVAELMRGVKVNWAVEMTRMTINITCHGTIGKLEQESLSSGI